MLFLENDHIISILGIDEAMEGGKYKLALPPLEKMEDKMKDSKDAKKGRKRKKKPSSENAPPKKSKCVESGCTYEGKKYHLEQHIRTMHMKIKLECDRCDFRCGDPRYVINS